MRDSFGREIDYMRISITDRCNLRCKYCMPFGIQNVASGELLTLEEIQEIAASAAELGIRHIKVTGGEPLVRKDCCHLVQMLKETPGIEKVTITTNGVLLEQYLNELVRAGIDGINISLDTTDSRVYHDITGSDVCGSVISAIEKASTLQIPVKVNAVSLKLEDISEKYSAESMENRGMDLLEIAKRYPVDVRFIEMMPIGYGKQFQAVSHQELLADMKRRYPEMKKDDRIHGFGPAVYYQIPGFLGSIGFISAIHGKFCERCNRVRLTSLGYLKTCLCYEAGTDLRQILRSEPDVSKRKQMLGNAIQNAVLQKPDAHCFDQPGQITEQHSMVMIGG